MKPQWQLNLRLHKNVAANFPANGSTISNYPDNQNTFPFEEVRLEIV